MARLLFQPPKRDDDNLSPRTWSAINGALIIAGIGALALLWRAVSHDVVLDPARARASLGADATDSATPADAKDGATSATSADPAAPATSASQDPASIDWQPPLTGKLRRTSPFNPHRMHPVLHRVMPHEGVDLGAASGTPVYAAYQGTLSWVGFKGPTGNLVLINHPGGIETGYAHLSRFAPGLHVGDPVATHQLVGYVGSTGRSTGPHLHFSAKKDGAFFDPETLIKIPAPTEADRSASAGGDSDMHEPADAAHPKPSARTGKGGAHPPKTAHPATPHPAAAPHPSAAARRPRS